MRSQCAENYNCVIWKWWKITQNINFVIQWLSYVQVRYNDTHSSVRSTVERAFGLLKGRFTRLTYINQNETESIVHTILAGCILHNECIMNNDDFTELMNEDPDPQELPAAGNFDEDMMNRGSIK